MGPEHTGVGISGSLDAVSFGRAAAQAIGVLREQRCSRGPEGAGVDKKLEIIVIPVSDGLLARRSVLLCKLPCPEITLRKSVLQSR